VADRRERKHLAAFWQLTLLNVRFCSVTDEGIVDLRQASHNVKVEG
jgi:hypothetical protein